MHDVIVIGGGPAGLTAAIYSGRRALKTLLFSNDIGGQIAKTYDIENYPGFDTISGIELAQKFKNQAERFGTTILLEDVQNIAPVDNHFVIKTNRGEYKSLAIILAFGKKPRELTVPGENEFKGRGVTYCATCDAPFFRNKVVAVVGGGNSALDATILASRICQKVFLIHRQDSFRAEQHLIDQVNSLENVEQVLKSEVVEIKGDQVVNSLVLKSGQEIAVNGVMVEIGYIVDRTLVEGLVEMDEKNQVIVYKNQETSVPGIFAAGDLTPTPYKQIIISAGEGAKAALAVFDYIQKLHGKRGIIGDWH